MLLAPVAHLGLAQVPGELGEAIRQRQAQHDRAVHHRRLDRCAGERHAFAGLRDDVELLRRVLAVILVDIAHPFGLVLRGPGLAEAQADAAVETLVDRLAERDALHGAAAPPCADVSYELVKRVLLAVVGGDHAHAAAPDEQRERGLEQLAELVVECGLVDDHHALLAAQVGRPAGERDDPLAGREADREGLDVLVGVVLPDAFLDLGGGVIERPGPHGAGLDVLDGHVLVVADVIDVLAAALSGDQHIVGGLGPGEADAPRFFADLERAVVLDPGALIGQQNRGRLGTGGRGQDGAETHFATPRISRRISCTASADSPPRLAILVAASAAWRATSWRIFSSRSIATLSAAARSLIARASSMISLGATASVSPMLPMVCHATVRSISLSSRPTSPSGSSSSRPTHTLATSCASRYRRICSRAERT